jgi:hypothetical protein
MGVQLGESVEFEERGHRIVLTPAATPEPQRESLVTRALAALSWWGVQESQWDWSVFVGDDCVGSGWELSQLAAREAARHWLDLKVTYGPSSW